MTEQTNTFRRLTRDAVELPDGELDQAIGGYSGAHALYQDIAIPANVAPSGESFYGTGVYKSVDSGKTW